MPSADGCLQELTEIHQVVCARSATRCCGRSSMPCNLPADEAIPIGRYGTSNVGRAKSVYRMGLSHRYGRRMQTISGIHYNFSLPGIGSDGYFALIRNFRRLSWLPLYLFGASPAVCTSFVEGRAARAAGARARHAVPAARDLAAHGAPRLPERRAGEPARELQQPRRATPRRCRKRSPGPIPPYEKIGIRDGDVVPAALDQPAADRERVLQPDPARSAASSPASARCTRCASAASSTSRCA